MLNVSTSVLLISKYSTCTQRWAGKLLPRSARSKWRLHAQALPSSIRSWTKISCTQWLSSACLCCKNHTKAGPAYYLNLVQLSKGIISSLVACVPPGTHLQQIQGEPWLCTTLCHALPCLPVAVSPRGAGGSPSWSWSPWSLLSPCQESSSPRHPSLVQPEEHGCVLPCSSLTGQGLWAFYGVECIKAAGRAQSQQLLSLTLLELLGSAVLPLNLISWIT